MKQILKIQFSDFWRPFDFQNNYFTQLLSEFCELEYSNSPDLLIYSSYGSDHERFNCHKLIYSAENERVNWNACDFAFGMDYIHGNERYYRLPNWIWYADPIVLTRPKPAPELLVQQKTKFCSILVSNPHPQKRKDFFKTLSSYKTIHSGGKVLNNIGEVVKDKLEFIKGYKFNIAFENSSHPGYTTEKIFEPMIVNSIPIYWGNPLVHLDFNPRSFINYTDFVNEKQLIEYIKSVDNDFSLYAKIICEPYYHGNKIPDYLRRENVRKFLVSVVDSLYKSVPIAKTVRRHFYFLHKQKIRVFNRLNSVIPFKKRFR